MTDYRVIRSRRKTVTLKLCADGALVVQAPLGMTDEEIRRIIEKKRAWIEKHRALLEQRANKEPLLTASELVTLKAQAKVDFDARVAHWAPIVGVSVHRITIRTQHTRWGSCSGKGNLNFNALLMLAPSEVRDYVVVHELCHRKEPNHSARFWAEVARVYPNYKKEEAWLKEHGAALIQRNPR